MMTPEQLEQQTQKEKIQRQRELRKIDLSKAISATTSLVAAQSQMSGLDRVNQSISTRIEQLKLTAINQILTLSDILNIQGIESGNPKLPEICPTGDKLNQALEIRDNFITQLETTLKYLNTINKSLEIVSDVINGTITTLTATNLLKITTSAATKLAPVVPGAAAALLADLDDVRTIVTFKNDGSPRLPELKRVLSTGIQYISQGELAINTVLQILKSVDTVLQNCGKIPRPLTAETLTTIQRTPTTAVYKGFTFDIVEKPYSPTVSQKIGQAKNQQGIVLLQTEPSFASDPQVLIEELKFIIDRDNLKAN